MSDPEKSSPVAEAYERGLDDGAKLVEEHPGGRGLVHVDCAARAVTAGLWHGVSLALLVGGAVLTIAGVVARRFANRATNAIEES